MLKNIDISGKNTTVFHSKPDKINPNSPLLVFIPGNPGIISYYVKYLSMIVQNGPDDLEVFGISHLGFTTNNEDEIYSLNEQVIHKIESIKYILGKEDISNREIYILGHSVGSWMVQRIVDTKSEFNYKFVGLITPTIIDIHKSQKGSLLWPLSRTLGDKLYKSAGFISNLAAQYAPNILIDYLLNFAIRTETFLEAKDITRGFILTPQFVKQSLGLATEEMNIIQSDWQYQDVWFDKHENLKKWIVFASSDHWISDKTQEQLINFFNQHKNIKVEINNDISHSFSINQSELFSDITLDTLNKLFHV